MFKRFTLKLAAVSAFAFGLAFASSVSANNCQQCWNNCWNEYMACIDDPNTNKEWCAITYNTCGWWYCGCDIP
jgi:hypothetical protein